MGATITRLDDHRQRRVVETAAEPARAAAAVVAGQRLLKDRELAEILGVTHWTIRNYRRAGMPAHPIGGSGYRFILADALAWLRQQNGGADDAPRAAS